MVVQTEMFLNLNPHPVCAASDASHFFLLAQPPSWPGGAMAQIYTVTAGAPKASVHHDAGTSNSIFEKRTSHGSR